MKNTVIKLFLEQVKYDIIEELLNDYNKYKNHVPYNFYLYFIKGNIDKELTIEELNNFAKRQHGDNISNIAFKTNKNRNQYVSRRLLKNINIENQCRARLWNNHIECQCSRSKKKGELCGIHYNMIQKNGKLRFGIIDEKLPEYDYYNNNKLWWF